MPIGGTFMEEKFQCDGDILNTVKTDVNTLREELQDSLTSAQNIHSAIKDSQEWKGRPRDAMAGFLDLITQFHASIVDGGGKGGKSPMDEMCTAMDDFCKSVDSFYEDFAEYKELKKIQ